MLRLLTATAVILAPASAFAEGQTMPQMDFKNPLTADQVGWMVVILVVLYLLLSRWALPQIGGVLADRAGVIARDLQTAQLAKSQADAAVAALNATMRDARAKAQAEIAEAAAKAKAEAFARSQELAARLDAQLEAAEAQIRQAQTSAMAAIKPVAEQAATQLLTRMTGTTPEAAALDRRIDEALAARQAA